MKFLAIIGVFAIFTGSLAYEDPHQNLTVDNLIKILSGLPMMVIPISDWLQRSKTAPILGEVYNNVSHHLQEVWKEVPPDIKETLVLGSNIFEGIMKKGYRAISNLNLKADMRQPLQDVMSYYGDPVLERLGPHLRAFEPTFNRIRTRMEDEVLPAYAKLLDDQLYVYVKQLEDAHPTLQGFADQVMTRFRQGAEALNKNLKPYLKPALEEIEKYKTEFEEWADTPIYPPDP